MRLYRFLYSIIIPFFRLVYRVKITGRENIPEEATVVCANHTTLLDPFFIAMAFGTRYPPIFMGKIEVFKIPVIGAILRAVGAIPVDRGSTSVTTLRDAIKRLEEGRKVVIFPEGTRVRGGIDVAGAKTGAAMIACRAGACMLPIHITAPKHIFGRADVIIGKPVDTNAFEGKGAEKYRAVVECVFGKIIELGNGGEADA